MAGRRKRAGHGDGAAAKCGAERKGRAPCAQPAGFGTSHVGVGRCRNHGGCTPTHVVAGQRALAEQAVATYGLPVDVSPPEALLDEVKWTAGHVAWLRAQVQALEREALAWGLTKREDQGATEFPGVNVTEQAVPNVWLDLYQRERKHLLDVCKAAIGAGLAERQVRLAEQQGAMLASVIRGILDDLGLTPEQAARVGEVVPRHLRAVA